MVRVMLGRRSEYGEAPEQPTLDPGCDLCMETLMSFGEGCEWGGVHEVSR